MLFEICCGDQYSSELAVRWTGIYIASPSFAGSSALEGLKGANGWLVVAPVAMREMAHGHVRIKRSLFDICEAV